jgi:hypothetical protein
MHSFKAIAAEIVTARSEASPRIVSKCSSICQTAGRRAESSSDVTQWPMSQAVRALIIRSLQKSCRMSTREFKAQRIDHTQSRLNQLLAQAEREFDPA